MECIYNCNIELATWIIVKYKIKVTCIQSSEFLYIYQITTLIFWNGKKNYF